jgi:hypothetical protein
MHTKDKLAEALTAVGLTDMAKKASDGYYHDFLSPLDFPEMQLLEDLTEQRMKQAMGGPQWHAINNLRTRHLNGDFDANLEESEAWARSPEGKDAFNRLVSGK